jgi:mannose-6-phosphate isomerase-like protein (cupin superfamily)
MPAEHFAARPLAEVPGGCRAIVPAPPEGWTHVPLGEWELRDGAGFGDCHPHEELNFVLEGLLVVECDGERVEAGPGDVVRVPAGHPAYYSAPTYARMVFIYGANPDGLPATTFTDR